MMMPSPSSADAPPKGSPKPPGKKRPRARTFVPAKAQPLTRGVIDRRTRAFANFTRVADGIAADLGGADQLTTIERALVEAFAGAAVALDDLSTRLLRGEQVDPGVQSQMITTLVRVATRLGTRRRAKTVTTPDLRTYIQRAAAPVAGGGSGTPGQPDPRAGGPAASSGTGAPAPGNGGGG
ncbi:hypothetical protein CCR97_22445 [Rhodoplanes elegans]|uniref:Uncharacterized protein n=1 Tax=Rhodoplanes elegans TaxID=29408 RepID=A0A327JY51_9BRAD|nr:hypothetical protein [Rhodoplanes elegans]MBK5960942.1 hypothetical protein [Rhodoplanes elegans]RAI30463.1 hypothetical protein CH338_27595 [Rhodoplanes elegans]